MTVPPVAHPQLRSPTTLATLCTRQIVHRDDIATFERCNKTTFHIRASRPADFMFRIISLGPVEPIRPGVNDGFLIEVPSRPGEFHPEPAFATSMRRCNFYIRVAVPRDAVIDPPVFEAVLKGVSALLLVYADPIDLDEPTEH
jgi:hypothetical protein